MFTVKFRVDVVHDPKAMAETGDSETSAYLVFEKQFKTKQAAEKWCLEHFDVQDEFRSGQYFVSPTPYGAGHDAAIFSIEIAGEDCGGLKP